MLSHLELFPKINQIDKSGQNIQRKADINKKMPFVQPSHAVKSGLVDQKMRLSLPKLSNLLHHVSISLSLPFIPGQLPFNPTL
jgi:hypothetical protein